MNAYTGMPVTYIPRPGRRETEMAALVTAVYADDRCDLIIFPPMGESYQQPKVPMLSGEFKTHVWVVPSGDILKALEGIANAVFGDLVEGSPGLKDQVAQLTARLEALEAKRGPGRPPNMAKSEAA